MTHPYVSGYQIVANDCHPDTDSNHVVIACQSCHQLQCGIILQRITLQMMGFHLEDHKSGELWVESNVFWLTENMEYYWAVVPSCRVNIPVTVQLFSCFQTLPLKYNYLNLKILCRTLSLNDIWIVFDAPLVWEVETLYSWGYCGPTKNYLKEQKIYECCRQSCNCCVWSIWQ